MDNRGVRTHPPSMENHKVIGFLRNIGPGLLENHKAAKQAFKIGQTLEHQRNAIK